VARPIVITGGGTGGHIFPMEAIAEALVALDWPSEAIRYVGSRRGQERRLLGGDAVALTLLPGRGIRRSLKPSAVVQNIGAVAGLAVAIVQSLYLVARWRPRAVVSVGGYAAFPFALVSALTNRRLVLVEFDAVATGVHRVLARFATRTCVAFSSTEHRAVLTGAPVRASIAQLDRDPTARSRAKSAQHPPIDQERFVVVVMTGSLGAGSVNAAVSELANLWSQRTDLCVIHVSGVRDYEITLARSPRTNGLDYRIVEFADMKELWSLADVALCRAGATTIAELTLLGIASVLVPLPGAPGDHQRLNAERLVDRDAAVMLLDRECNAESVAKALDELLKDDRCTAVGANARALGHPHAAQAIAQVVLSEVRG
jgi:UDP-N-acetylglucosamine--N-acetylmuramyl-(pentapeptide) pyrophosphoryl-undecaprenol N-acetylglucosamine transferase